MEDMVQSGRATHLYGENNYNAKFEDNQIEEVFRLRILRKSQKEIAELLNISVSYVNAILNNRARKHQFKKVDNSPVRSTKNKSKHSEDLKRKVRDLYLNDCNVSQIARQLNVKRSFVASLIKREGI